MRLPPKMTRIRIGTFSTIVTPSFFLHSGEKMIFRLIFMFGCAWFLHPKLHPIFDICKYHPWNRILITYCINLLINSNFINNEHLWLYRLKSLQLHFAGRTGSGQHKTKSRQTAEYQCILRFFVPKNFDSGQMSDRKKTVTDAHPLHTRYTKSRYGLV